MKSLISITTLSLICVTLFSCATMELGESYGSTGHKLYAENCFRCHREATTLNEPEDFLLETIHDGGRNMPSFEESLSKAEQRQVVDYILNQR
ncbi:MAG: cytochrome c [Pseudomonadota bacterium]